MNPTARMAALLGAFRRERNGLVADTMHYDGARYGLNYGVSLPTVRAIARREATDHPFACFLLEQQVRELQLTALHLAEAERLTEASEAARWRQALRNTELAEEAAFALLSRTPALPQLLPVWLAEAVDEPLPAYAAVLAAARSERPSAAWVDPILQALHRVATEPRTPAYAARRIAEAAVAFAVRLADTEETARPLLRGLSERLGATAAEQFVAEELAWRLEG